MKKVFSLLGVTTRERDEICEILETKGVSFYVTPRPGYGFDSSAIWVTRQKDYKRALKLIARYQKERLKLAQRNEKPTKSFRKRWFNTNVLLLIFSIIILTWMYFMGLWRP